MEKREQNFIRQLLTEIEEYFFSLSWEENNRLIRLVDIIPVKSIFQIVPKRFLMLLEQNIYTEPQLKEAIDKAYKLGLARQRKVDSEIYGVADAGTDEQIREKWETVMEFDEETGEGRVKNIRVKSK